MSSTAEDKMNLTDLILECDIIPILVEKELAIECCIRGYHVYQDQDTKIGNTLKVSHETRVAALVEDKYAMAVKSDDKTIGHIPKDLSKITYFFLKKDGKFNVKITGPRQYSRDLIQGGMELPCTYTYSTTDEGLYGQLVELIADFMENYRNRIQKLEAKNMKKKKKNTEKK